MGVFKIAKEYIYRGFVFNGLFHGFGRYEDKIEFFIYEGNYVEGHKEGFGRQFVSSEEIFYKEYEGFWK